MDISLGVIIFIASFFIVYSAINPKPAAIVSNLREEATVIIRQIASGSSPMSVVVDNEVIVNKLNELKNLTYEELKQRLRIEGDFCIYMEDENGNIVLINNSYRGVGSPNIDLAGAPCSQK